ncbi:MAG: cytochrome c oxidase subunit 3 [Aggregatilineales bacterium]
MATTVAGQIGHHHDDAAKQEQIANLKLATWLYIASETVIFAVLIGAFAVFRILEPQYAKAVHAELGVALVTINTFILLASSYAMVMALRAAEMKNRQGFMQWMGAVIGMGLVFVGLQFVEYTELSHLAITLGDSTDDFGRFGMYFYAPTFFHGAHVLVGALMGLEVLRRGMRGDFDDNAIIVELFGLYWHFVDVVWIILFALIYLV